MSGRMTPAQAATRGHLAVNGCVGLTMLGIPGLTYGAVLLLGFGPSSALAAAASAFLVSWPLAWLTWSLLVPRWRVWAYERVEKLDELKMHAVTVGLIWREGHFFERTEIRTHDQRERIRKFEESWAAKQRDESGLTSS
ncbi:MAG: hypothetical protein KKC29_06805 [Alphaproteobacteria bacterium]|nr:hypothetical protein [Alphaproteobacteria bacterium]MBU2040716.1 hypothetical protein [Alphaproteobacteria bacterium]MBU2125211.1 hypothetical protein [Alphaproteobacteria bacterium]MBU2207765.1 hypothetical protein [Alphaproteobacteria bacterium]MBU2290791.1 hypothetical protein [Alphaproteobacteria bacterium]